MASSLHGGRYNPDIRPNTRVVRVTAPPGSSSSTIDLGEISATNLLEERGRQAAGIASSARSGGSRIRRRRQRPLAALLVPLCLVTLIGASVADRQLGAPLWTAKVSLAGFSLGADSIYVSEPGARSMAALDAGTGRVRWRLALDEPLIEAVDLGGGNVAVVTRTPGPNDETDRQKTITSVDPTGRVLAIHHGDLLGVLEPGGLALLAMSTTWPVCTDEPWTCMDLVAVEPGSGRTVWRIGPVRVGQWFIVPDRDRRITTIATVGPTGAVMLRDPLTGAVAKTVTALGLDQGPTLSVAGIFVAVTGSAGRVELTGRRLGSLEYAWRLTLTVPEPVDENNRFFYADPCGDLLCVHIGRSTFVIEPQRGSVVFEAPYDIVVRLGGGRFLAVPPRNPLSSLYEDGDTVYLLDGDNGSVLNTLTGGFGVAWVDGGGRELLLRQGRFTEVVLVDADGEVSRLGDIEGTELNCLARGVVLACSEPSGRLRVWHLPDQPK